jgi:hypothetical protein
MKYELHPACSAWPPMKQEELQELADDIAAYGLRDPVTLTPEGFLLDGRNRALACEMAGVEPATTIFDGDPWLFSLSRNRHRRHMSVGQIAMVTAKLATMTRGGDRRSLNFKTSNEGLKVAEAAAAAGVPKTAVESAKVVLKEGMPEEIKAVESGEAPLRKTADQIRDRKRASQRPATPRVKKTPVHSRDPYDDVTRELITKCAGPKAEWRTLDKMWAETMRAKPAIKVALERLGDAVKTRTRDGNDEYLIEGDRKELLVRAGLMVAQPEQSAADFSTEIASLRAENADLRAKLTNSDTENERLRAENERLGAEIERLKNALYEKVVEVIAAKFAAKGETNPTVDHVVMAARDRAFEIDRAETPVFGEKEIA